jgi:hypothetical protein
MDDLDSPAIRQLILEAKLPQTQIIDVVRQVLDSAKAKGLIETAPDVHYANPLADKIAFVIWELIMEGIYAPGHSAQQLALPFIRATGYGMKCFEAGYPTPHDPDGYLKRLAQTCPTIDDVTILYVEEALAAFRVGKLIASTVMIGVASENLLIRLADAVSSSLDTPQKQAKFRSSTASQKAKKIHDEVIARLRSPTTPLPPELNSVLTQHIDGIFDLIRRHRNDAGHPTGIRMQRDETLALMLLFPSYCKTVHGLIDWLSANQI